MKKMYNREVLMSEFDGCVMVWIDKEDGETYVKGNAWEDLAMSMIYKYKFKRDYIKRVKYKNSYDGTKIVTFYEDYGKRVYQFVD